MTAEQIEDALRKALAALQEIEYGLGDVLADPKAKPQIGRRETRFALDDIDDARDALFGCGRRYGLDPERLESPRL